MLEGLTSAVHTFVKILMRELFTCTYLTIILVTEKSFDFDRKQNSK